MIKRFLGFMIVLSLLLPSVAFAQTTLLPDDPTDKTTKECTEWQAENETAMYGWFDAPSDANTDEEAEKLLEDRQIALSCAIKTGRIRLWMLPYFIKYIATFFIGLSGVISLLFVIIGGFWYMTGGLTDDKEKGKKTIMYALIGMVITLLAWIIVNVVQVQVTG